MLPKGIRQVTDLSTPILNYVWLPFCLLVFICMVAYIFIATEQLSPGIIILFGMLLMGFLAWLKIRNLRQISYDDKRIYLKSFRYERVIELEDVRSVNKPSYYLDPAFEIELYPKNATIEKIEFLPSLGELLYFLTTGKHSGELLRFKQVVDGRL